MPTMTTSPPTAPLSIGDIAQRIQLIRGQSVVIDGLRATANDVAAVSKMFTKRDAHLAP
jgi:hypothetical protein